MAGELWFVIVATGNRQVILCLVNLGINCAQWYTVDNSTLLVCSSERTTVPPSKYTHCVYIFHKSNVKGQIATKVSNRLPACLLKRETRWLRSD